MTSPRLTPNPEPADDVGVNRRDRGMSLVEVLVAVVLLGLGAAGTLTALSSAVSNSDRHRSMATAEAWIQSAGDYLASAAVVRVPCYTTTSPNPQEAIRSAYETALRANTRNSDNWPATQLRVLTPVQYWNGTSFGTDQTTHCLEIPAAPALWAQLVTIQVTSPDGKVTRTLTVVKGR